VRILFDQGTPVPLRRSLNDHLVATAYELGWSTVTNGKLIRLAEQEGYELLITTDTNLCYQQNLTGRRIAILVLTTTGWSRIRQFKSEVQCAVALIREDDYQKPSDPEPLMASAREGAMLLP
jgi:predicted nuclease of predicted toxin-antitoxin system